MQQGYGAYQEVTYKYLFWFYTEHYTINTFSYNVH